MSIRESDQNTILSAQNYVIEHRASRYKIEYADGGTYICKLISLTKPDEAHAEDNPEELWALEFSIISLVVDGHRRHDETLIIDEKDFPTRITDLDQGCEVFASE